VPAYLRVNNARLHIDHNCIAIHYLDLCLLLQCVHTKAYYWSVVRWTCVLPSRPPPLHIQLYQVSGEE